MDLRGQEVMIMLLLQIVLILILLLLLKVILMFFISWTGTSKVPVHQIKTPVVPQDHGMAPVLGECRQ